MAWGRMDDAFDDHPKVLALLEMEGAASAVGLWTLCWTWAHRNTRKKGKTPGLIPASLPRRFFGPEARSMADLLVKVGLWDEADDGGWMIHDFADYLPGKDVSEARAAAGRKGAAKRWGSKEPPPDDNGMAPPKQPNDKPMAPSWQGHSNLPSGDSSEPSDDGNPVASDSSRAGARREWVAVGTTDLSPIPSPTPVPPSAGAAAPRDEEPVTARTIVGEWIDRCARRPPGDVIGQISKRVKAMLDEGIHPDFIRRGLAEWMTRDVHPSVLPSLVNSVMNASNVRPLRATGTDGRPVAAFAAGSGARAYVQTAEEIENAEVNL